MINRAKMPRQLRNKGGITNVTPRTNYFLGGIKRRIRKLIPNELADIAVKAAPFVAPFNPAIAGLMRGIGRFDQRGSISDALKQGFGTYAGGQLFRTIGGAGAQEGLGGFRLSSPLSESRTAAIKNLFTPKETLGPTYDEAGLEVAKGTVGTGTGTKTTTRGIGAIEKLRQQIPIINKLDPIVGQQLIVGGATSAASLVYDKFANDFREHDPETESYEEYLAQRKETVGRQMRQYFDNYFKFDKEYSALDDAGKDAFVARYNVKDGGRIKYKDGGDSIDFMVEKELKEKAPGSYKLFGGGALSPLQHILRYLTKKRLLKEKEKSKKAEGGLMNIPTGVMKTNKAGVMERDYRDKGGFVPVGIKEKADDVPAMLSKNEFVMTADAVRGAGNGSIEKGAQKMYDTMKRLEKRVV